MAVSTSEGTRRLRRYQQALIRYLAMAESDILRGCDFDECDADGNNQCGIKFGAVLRYAGRAN